ncbi:MAG TPA: prepilin-type N-terminal cleavage/methylation domain-containing protein [Clostridia bacterium]|nr:prepilin-type N-terminal cleavage/methylation domain-containing protein [Clostridia bacterium]
MINNKNGFTLIEVLVTLFLFSIIALIVISPPSNMYYRILLKSTAIEIREALYLSQQLSLDECKSYCVELIEGNKFRVREHVTGGKVVSIQEFNKDISVSEESDKRISYTRSGETNYGKFILVNKKGRKIGIDALIGTGKVRILDIY